MTSGYRWEGTDCVSNNHPLSCVPPGEKLNFGGERGQRDLPNQSEEIFLRLPAEIYFLNTFRFSFRDVFKASCKWEIKYLSFFETVLES